MLAVVTAERLFRAPNCLVATDETADDAENYNRVVRGNFAVADFTNVSEIKGARHGIRMTGFQIKSKLFQKSSLWRA
jgi:hypothetical protein